MKLCNQCKIEKFFNEFYSDHRTNKPRSICKKCHSKNSKIYAQTSKLRRAELGRKYYNKNKEHISETRKKRYRTNIKEITSKALYKQYGITIEQRDIIAAHQNFSCAICSTPENMLKKKLNIDHSHETGKIRGLLCYNCNRGIGLLKDSARICYSAAKYLDCGYEKCPGDDIDAAEYMFGDR